MAQGYGAAPTKFLISRSARLLPPISAQAQTQISKRAVASTAHIGGTDHAPRTLGTGLATAGLRSSSAALPAIVPDAGDLRTGTRARRRPGQDSI
jgi:hypothetical protein